MTPRVRADGSRAARDDARPHRWRPPRARGTSPHGDLPPGKRVGEFLRAVPPRLRARRLAGRLVRLGAFEPPRARRRRHHSAIRRRWSGTPPPRVWLCRGLVPDSLAIATRFRMNARSYFAPNRRQADWRKQARLMRIRKHLSHRLWVQMAKRAEATYANRVLRPLVVWLRRIAPPSRRSQPTTPRVARWLQPSLPSASSLLRRSRPSVASRSARARPVRPPRSRLPAPPLVWIGRSPREMPRRAVTSTATRPRVAARVRRDRLTHSTRISPLALRTRTHVSSRLG